MELILIRTYFPGGTNGSIQLASDPTIICYTIELPWKNNQHGISCIPEKRYAVKMRFTQKRQWHMILQGVQDRSLILIHPANDAMKELQGCIAPVTIITGEGKGSASRPAFEKLKQLISATLEKEPVFIHSHLDAP